VHLRQARVDQVAAVDARADERGDHPGHPRAFPGGRRGVDDLLHVAGLDVLAGDSADDRRHEPLAQSALGVGVRAGPPLVNREAVGVEVVGDQVSAGVLVRVVLVLIFPRGTSCVGLVLPWLMPARAGAAIAGPGRL
jgi:hypothetical protein